LATNRRVALNFFAQQVLNSAYPFRKPETYVKEKAKSLAEGVSESTAACLLAMVQGNILALTIGHVMIAAQTGLIAGSIALAFGLLVRTKSVWITPLLLGVCTAAVDYLVHPSNFGTVATEALVTGLVAGLLAFLVGAVVRFSQKRKGNPATA
jgi:hypothetical protein